MQTGNIGGGLPPRHPNRARAQSSRPIPIPSTVASRRKAAGIAIGHINNAAQVCQKTEYAKKQALKAQQHKHTTPEERKEDNKYIDRYNTLAQKANEEIKFYTKAKKEYEQSNLYHNASMNTDLHNITSVINGQKNAQEGKPMDAERPTDKEKDRAAQYGLDLVGTGGGHGYVYLGTDPL